MNPTSYLFGSRFACAQTGIFSKMRERHQLFFGLWLMTKEFQNPAIQTKIKLKFAANKKAGFYANPDQNKQEVGFIFA
jgi:hypothetical protein